MARYWRWGNSNWSTAYIMETEVGAPHKHQNRVLLTYKEKVHPKNDVFAYIDFHYVDAKRFLKSPDFHNLPWRFISDSHYFRNVDNISMWKETFYDNHLVNYFSAADKKDLLSILEEFINRVDKKYRHRRKKRF
jgi:hypothetical protein